LSSGTVCGIYLSITLGIGKAVAYAEKVLENRLRRRLDRMGYRLMKSRARDPYDLTFGGYQIVDVQINGLVAGHGHAGRGYAMTLGDVQEWIVTE
jgi:hypothetical protein